MKKLLFLLLIAAVPYFSNGQSCSPSPSCEKTSCGPEGTKKSEAKVITSLRSDLQSVIDKMSKSSVAFDKELAQMTIAQGASDDESLLFISQAASSIRYELTSKLEPGQQVASLRDFRPKNFSTKAQMVSALKKEISVLADQAEKL